MVERERKGGGGVWGVGGGGGFVGGFVRGGCCGLRRAEWDR